jgi:hypothetical protein
MECALNLVIVHHMQCIILLTEQLCGHILRTRIRDQPPLVHMYVWYQGRHIIIWLVMVVIMVAVGTHLVGNGRHTYMYL